MGRSSSITVPRMAGIVRRAPAEDEKSVMFKKTVSVVSPLRAIENVCLFLSRFGLTKFVITETVWSNIIFKTIIVSLHRGVCICIQLFLWTPNVFPYGQIYTKKLWFFEVFEAVGQHFLKPERWNLARGCGPGTPPAKFYKSRSRGYTPFGQIYTKNY